MSTIKALRIDHIAIQTMDLQKAIKFYVEVIGAELLEKRNFKKREMAWLRIGNNRIEIFSPRAGEELQSWNDYHPGPVHLAFVVENLEEFLQHAGSRGVPLHPSHPAPFVPPVPGAGTIAYVLGPDGEEVEIREQAQII